MRQQPAKAAAAMLSLIDTNSEWSAVPITFSAEVVDRTPSLSERARIFTLKSWATSIRTPGIPRTYPAFDEGPAQSGKKAQLRVLARSMQAVLVRGEATRVPYQDAVLLSLESSVSSHSKSGGT
ncbi:predicted protein [Plenodomus lingam JN3]|uniref:Predicted protein n=2 Tax=Leptosphaeria maculans TaxID=5022 RepID=E4ZP32_LEPMJ|nr:predicted protein [Plenodomus lingam JN3]CBX93401.1 predicted protein [Plenodomus lingam JN3]